ncbi:MAG: hypothetical protein ABW034_00640 [Steroidobacteraceae bacterium]
MFTNAFRALSTVLFLFVASTAIAQDSLPYKEGAVVVVTSVRTQPGKFDDYYRYLTGPYSQMMDEGKKMGLVTNYQFLMAFPRSEKDPDLYIVETYPSMAVFDGMMDKMSDVSKKIFGSLKQASQADANREEFRKILGTEMMRELTPRK